jgi:hypothetical protein
LQSQSGPRVHVQPVALPPAGQAGVPLVDGDIGPRPQQALGEAEPAEAAAGHCYAKIRHGGYYAWWPDEAPAGPRPEPPPWLL